MKAWFPLALVAALPASALALQAQPVPVPEEQGLQPQVQLAGVGVATVGWSKDAERPSGRSGIDFSDSALLLGASQRLVQADAIGSLGFGGLTTHTSDNGGTSVFLHQAFVDFQSERLEALIGRSDSPTAHVVDLPTLRGDDLVTLSNPLNPYSNGEISEEHRYSNVAQLTLNQGLRYFENFHVQHLIDSAGIGTVGGINSFGASFSYLGPPGMDAFGRVPSAGFGYEHITLNASSPGGLHQIYGGGVINLNTSVTERVDFRVQDYLNLGSDLNRFASITDTFQANSNSVSASLRYLHSPFGQPGYQLALTGGYQDYLKVDEAKSAGVAVTGVRSLGQGFDVVAQVLAQWRSSALAQAQTGGVSTEQVAEVGLIYNFSATFNPHLSPRRSLLNQQHQYVPN